MKRLPKVYQNDFNKKIKNNREVCYLDQERSSTSHTVESSFPHSVEDALLEIFSGVGYAYNIPIILTTTNKVYETSLIAKTKNNVITLDNDIIPISDIKNIDILK